MSAPDDAPVDGEQSKLLAQGWALHKAGDHRAALAMAERLLEEFEETPASLLLAGEVHFSRANFVRTERLASRCMERFPEDLSGAVLKCRSLLALGRSSEARDLALCLADKPIDDDTHIDILVTVLSGCMEPEAAYPLCQRALEIDPYNATAHRRLALTCRLTGRLEEAVQAADIALRFNPHDYEMIGLRSALRTATVDDNAIGELELLLRGGCTNALGTARVAYALAKEYEDLGNAAQSFRYLEAGARCKRLTLKYDVNQDLAAMADLQRTFTAGSLADERAGCDSSEPIFILGLPRTGSTLLERILSSHSALYAAGELSHLNAAMVEETGKLGPATSAVDLMQKSLQADPAAIGQNYLQRTRPFTGHTPYFIDKRPLNFLLIGLIHKALPNARIIHMCRTPLDACFSIYKFLFNDAYPWSYDLHDIADYYCAYHRLMAYWRTLLPGRIIDVAYENLVADLESETRTLFDTLGLGFEPACLEFHRNKAAAMTGSSVQVRQRLYASSVGRWRDHEAALKSVADKLSAAGIDPYRHGA